MKENCMLRKNEKEANMIVAKVMRITFVIFTLVYILNVIGIFVVDKTIMTLAYIGGGILLWMPTILVCLLKLEKGFVKYINVICAAIFVMLLSTTLTYHVVVIYVYPIAIASLYFSKRLNITATALTVFGVSVGQLRFDPRYPPHSAALRPCQSRIHARPAFQTPAQCTARCRAPRR